MIKAAISIYKFLQSETTNDAQVVEYINPVIARVGGYVREVKFNDFDTVNAGDTLFVIDSQEYQLDENQVGAELQKQNANNQVLNQQSNTLQAEAQEAYQAIEAAKVKVWKENLEYERYKQLFNEKSATAQKLEQIQANLNIYKSELSQAEQHYKVSKEKIEDLKQEKTVIGAEKERLYEIKQRRNLDVGYTVITAPYKGRLGKRKIEKGQMIDIGDHLCYIVNDETPKWVMANFKETQIAKFSVGDIVTITADAYPNQKFDGKILAFSPATGSSFSLLPPDNATGNFVKIVQRIPVKIELTDLTPEWRSKLLSGMNVTITVPHH
jgi:membrane fusion protein (multidrug efflux system)